MITEHPSYLRTTPVGEDLFIGKSHEAISKRIAQQIKNGNHCQMIGIDGGWGSGKSNLVKLISNELNAGISDKKKQMFPFITYDAWGHSSDLQRRTILEEITKSLITDYECLDNSWQLKLNELLSKKKSTHNKKVPRLSTTIKVGMLLVALTPLINWLVSLVPDKCVWGKILTSMIPYIVGIVYVVYKKHCDDKKYGITGTASFSSYFEELFLVYKGKISEESTYEVISEKEPSSSQFKEWMHQLDGSIRDSKKVILVFDNMDRLPIAKVQEFWAAIHSFFAEESFDNLVIIVPFDRSHIINAFKSEDNTDNSHCYGNDFINKTFSVVHRVAPPIMSDWKAFFYQKWKDAFGKEASPDKEVTQIYDAMTPEITPRNIIAFINELITLKFNSDLSIPDRYLALYIFGKDEISAKPSIELLSPSFLGNLSCLYSNDTDMPKFMSAIHYQLPVEKSMDIVFTRQMKTALDNNEVETINQLAKDNSTFKSIAEIAILDVTNIENATIALEKADLSNIEKGVLDYIWRCLYHRIHSLKADFTRYKPFHSILLSHISQTGRKNYISMLIKQYQSIKEDSFDCQTYIQGIDALRKVDSFHLDCVLECLWQISPALFVKLTQITKDSYNDYGYYCPEEDLDEYLSDLSISDWKSIFINKTLADEYKLNRFEKKLLENLKSSGNNVDDVRVCIERLKEIRSYIDNADSIMTDSAIYNILGSIDSKNPIFYDLICIGMSKCGSYQYRGYSPYSTMLSSPSDQDIISISNTIKWYINYGDLLVSYSSYDSKLTNSVVRHLTNSYNTHSRASITNCLKNYTSIKAHYSLEAKALLTKLAGWSTHYKGEDVFSPELIKDCLNVKNDLSIVVLNALNSTLQSKSQEVWCYDLKNSHTLADYYVMYHPEINQNLFDAIKEQIDSCVTNNTAIANQDIVGKLLSICNVQGCDVKNFFIDTLNKFNTNQSTKGKVIALAPWIFQYVGNDLETYQDYLFKFLVTEVLEDDAIISILNKNRQMLSFKKPDDFKRKIKQLAEANGNESSEIWMLAKYWKLIKDKK